MRNRPSLAVLALAVAVALVTPADAANREHQLLMADLRILQEQSQQVQNAVGTLASTLTTALTTSVTESFKTVTIRIDEQMIASRRSVADQRLVVDTLSSDVRVLREKLDDNSVRLGSLTQEIEALRAVLQQLNLRPAGSGSGAGGASSVVAGTPPSAVAAPLRGEPAGREATRRRRAGASASSTVDSDAAVPSPFLLVAAGVGSASWGVEPPAWRSLIAAMRSPLRIFAVSAMFNSPASWRSSASTIVLRPLRRVGAAVPPGVSGAPASGAVPVVTRSVSLTKVLPDRPGTFPGQRITCSSGRCAGRLSG